MNLRVQKMLVSGFSFSTVGDPDGPFATPSSAAGAALADYCAAVDSSFNQVWLMDHDTGAVLLRAPATA